MASTDKPKAINLAHHLSDASRARQVSPLKGLQRFLGNPNLIMMSGGTPNPAYFPFSTLEADTLVSDSFSLKPTEFATSSHSSSNGWFWNLLGAAKQGIKHISIPKYASEPTDLALATTLQYGLAQGAVPLQKFLHEFAGKVFQPAFEDWTAFIHAGNTDAWSKVVSTLCNAGEGVLADEWTYPSAMANARPVGVTFIPVKMDGEGMRSDDLRKVLSEWDETARGGIKRPHVLYIVPIGQNPCGLTMGGARKKEIYDICVEYDIIIVEDDPYYFQQEGAYVPKASRKAPKSSSSDADDYIASLSPSFLRFDYQGRVIRLDTFSKTIAPGSRLGWYTCNPLFAERIERATETSTQAPCGFGQTVITKLLANEWGIDGFIRWLRGISAQYAARRDFFLDTFLDEFSVTQSIAPASDMWGGCTVYTARAQVDRTDPLNEKRALFGQGQGRRLFSFVAPTSGMFVWVKVYVDGHPSFVPGDEETLEMQFMVRLAEGGLLVSPGWFFEPDLTPVVPPRHPEGEAHYRISYSSADHATMRKSVKIFAKALREFFEDAA